MNGYLFHDPQRLQKEMILIFDIWLELFVRVRVEILGLGASTNYILSVFT